MRIIRNFHRGVYNLETHAITYNLAGSDFTADVPKKYSGKFLNGQKVRFIVSSRHSAHATFGRKFYAKSIEVSD